MATPESAASDGHLDIGSQQNSAPICVGCKQVMLDIDGNVRDPKGVAHHCDCCGTPIHSAVMCEAVWFPVVNSLCRMFCCKEHLVEWNNREDTLQPLPVRRRQEDLENANSSGVDGDTQSDQASSVQATNADGVPAAATATTNDGLAPAAAEELGTARCASNSSVGTAPGDAAATAATPVAAPSPAPDDNSVEKFEVGRRMQMNFKPDGSSWYGGTVGLVTDAEVFIGFDDGELRPFKMGELQGLQEIGLCKFLELGAQATGGGQIDSVAVRDRAEGLTLHKEGRMTHGKPVGVLVGVHAHGVGGLTVHVAHHVDMLSQPPEDRQPRRSRTGADRFSGRKGYHTYRCGDAVQCTSPQAESMVAVVFGVVVATVGSQLRRLLVLCEHEGGGAAAALKHHFFVAPWATWRRMPPDSVPESPSFDPDDDDLVKSLPEDEVNAMRKVWESSQPLSKLRNGHSVVSSAIKDGIPPSVVRAKKAKPKPPAPARAPGPAPAPVPAPVPAPKAKRPSRQPPQPKPPQYVPSASAPASGVEFPDDIEPSLTEEYTSDPKHDGHTPAATVPVAEHFAELQRADAKSALLVRMLAERGLAPASGSASAINPPNPGTAAAAQPHLNSEAKHAYQGEYTHASQQQQHAQAVTRSSNSTSIGLQLTISMPHIATSTCISIRSRTCSPVQHHTVISMRRTLLVLLLAAACSFSIHSPAIIHQPLSRPAAREFYSGHQHGAFMAQGAFQHIPPPMTPGLVPSPPTPDSERALVKHIRILKAQQFEDGVEGLGKKLAGLEYELESKRKDRKRKRQRP